MLHYISVLSNINSPKGLSKFIWSFIWWEPEIFLKFDALTKNWTTTKNVVEPCLFELVFKSRNTFENYELDRWFSMWVPLTTKVLIYILFYFIFISIDQMRWFITPLLFIQGIHPCKNRLNYTNTPYGYNSPGNIHQY